MTFRIKKWHSILILAGSIFSYKVNLNTQPVEHQTPEKIANYIYGPQGLNVPVTDYQKIKTLLTALAHTPQKEIIKTIPLVIDALEHTLHETDAYIKNQYDKHELVPLQLFFKTYMINQQINHIKNITANVSHNEGFFAWMQKITIKSIEWAQSLFIKKEQLYTPEQQLANQIIAYAEYERQHILLNYNHQLSFFASIKKMPLPELINFWSSQEIQRQMYLRAQQVSDRIVTQFGLDTIVDFAIQGILMAGSSMDMQWINQDDATIFQNYQKIQNNIQQNWQTFISGVQKQSQDITSNILATFKAALSNVQQQYTTSNKLLSQEIQYLMRSLSVAQPKQLFLEAPINYDIAFQAAPMATPTPHTWYNIAQKGDWEYDPQTNGFWQNGLQLFGTPAWKIDPQTKKAGLDVPEFNSIFTESIINGSSYDIEVECTIYSITGSPFFVGVMFNKARWLSGDPERLTGYRLCGLYGSQKGTTESSVQSIDAVFAEQQIIPALGDTREKIISPMQMIDTQPTTHFASNVVAAEDLRIIGVDPLTFVFSISTTPNNVTCTVSKQVTSAAGAISLTQLAQKTIEGLTARSFLYHGIGFMAPGCQASFKLIKPVELVYTQNQVQAYKPPKQS